MRNTIPKYNITFKNYGVLVDSGSPYEIYRHISNMAAYHAGQYRKFGKLSNDITIERIEEDEKLLRGSKRS